MGQRTAAQRRLLKEMEQQLYGDLFNDLAIAIHSSGTHEALVDELYKIIGSLRLRPPNPPSTRTVPDALMLRGPKI